MTESLEEFETDEVVAETVAADAQSAQEDSPIAEGFEEIARKVYAKEELTDSELDAVAD